MARSAHSIRALPASASDGSAMSPGVPAGMSPSSVAGGTGRAARPPGRGVRGPAVVLALALALAMPASTG